MLICGPRPGTLPYRECRCFVHSRVTFYRSLFRDSDATDEEDGGEEFTGFSGNLEGLNSDDDEAEEYAPLSPTHPNSLNR